MSARSFKIFSGVFLAHLVALNIIWVGFSVPFPRPPATFTYEGALPLQGAESGAEDVWQKGKTSGQFVLDRFTASRFNHWIELRGPSKSFTYGHLGF